MGRSRRPPPRRLAEKLREIRRKLGLTQQQMLDRLGEEQTPPYRGYVGLYEQGKREPPVLVLMKYARIAGVPMELLVDDRFDLPEDFPGMPEYVRMMKRAGLER